MKKNCVSNSQKEEERRRKKKKKEKERKTYPLDHHVTFRPLVVRLSIRNDFLSVLQFVNVHN